MECGAPAPLLRSNPIPRTPFKQAVVGAGLAPPGLIPAAIYPSIADAPFLSCRSASCPHHRQPYPRTGNELPNPNSNAALTNSN
jgi:hypothetical protein